MNFKLGIRLLAFAAALCMAACDFEDINHNPHEPTDKDLEPDYYGTGLLFMQMQNYVIPVEKNQYQLCENLIGDTFGRYMAGSRTTRLSTRRWRGSTRLSTTSFPTSTPRGSSFAH